MPKFLVPYIAVARFGKITGTDGFIKEGSAYDCSILPYFLEQMLGSGVTRFGIPGIYYENAIDGLHPQIKRRLTVFREEDLYGNRVVIGVL